jgi:protease I
MSTQARSPVYVFVSDDYQEMEFWYPLLRLREDDVPVEVVGEDVDRTYHSRLRYPVLPERALTDAAVDGCSAILLTGGKLAAHKHGPVLAWVKAAMSAGKTIGITSGASWILEAVDIASAGGPESGVRVLAGGKVVAAGSAEDLPQFYQRFSSVAFE